MFTDIKSCVTLLKHLLIAGILFLTLASFRSTDEYIFYVSPNGSDTAKGTSLEDAFASIAKAQEAVRQLKKKGTLNKPVTIFLREGIYQLKSPLLFTPDDSGTGQNPITYTAYKSEKVIISGGRKLTGWKKFKNNIWILNLPEVKNEGWKFKQLFVNGEQRQRARTPNQGLYRVTGFPDGGPEVHYQTKSQRFKFAKGDLNPAWKNLQDAEVIVYHFWTDAHLPIQSIDNKTDIVTFQHKSGKVFTDDFTKLGARYLVENIFEAMDEPGEWYLNKTTGKLYYIAKPGEDMNTAEVIAPVLAEFITLQGKAVEREFVEHINFNNISFMYNNWDLPPGNSNNSQGSASVPACITLKGTRYCTFSQCQVSNIGTFAFEISNGCSFNQFTNNEIAHIAAGGFRINGGTEASHPLERTGYNIISDNVLHHYGEIYPSAVGILLMNTNNNTVSHNTVHHGGYTGISIGWVWGYQRSVSSNNIIEYNYIHHIGQGLLSDMGGIYTLGVSPGTVLRNNLIHDVDANQYGGWGIYNDEGSTHILIENNIVYNTKFAPYNIHFSKEVTVRNNIFAFGKLEQISRGKVEPHKSVYLEKNIVYWKTGELFSKAWQDKPYTFHFHPKNPSGTREVSSTADIDWNIYFNPTLSLDSVKFNGKSWTEWQKQGRDVHSVYKDPMFIDAENYDFRLRPESPAFAFGFQQIDMSTVGSRKKQTTKGL